MDEENHTFGALPEYYSDILRECIATCMSFDPKRRPTANDLYQLAQIPLCDQHLEDSVEKLISKDIKGSYGNDVDQAFLKACYFGNEFVARHLLERGANVQR